MVMKGGKKRALSPAKEGEAATIEEVPLTRSVSTRLSGAHSSYVTFTFPRLVSTLLSRSLFHLRYFQGIRGRASQEVDQMDQQDQSVGLGRQRPQLQVVLDY